jgi:hypothetical protein
LGNNSLYNSSSNIERHFLATTKLETSEFRVQVGDLHNPMNIEPFGYEERLSDGEGGRVELGQFFWNLLEEKFANMQT